MHCLKNLGFSFQERGGLCLTDVCLINVFDPVRKKHIRDDEKVQFHDELALFRRVFVCEPADMVPFSAFRCLGHVGGRCCHYWKLLVQAISAFLSTIVHGGADAEGEKFAALSSRPDAT